MKAALAIAMLATMASVLDQCTGHRHITGEVFLATPSGVNLKLGLVTVCAFDKSSLTVALKKRGKVAADHIERLTNIAHRAGDLATRIDTEYETLTPLLSVEISSVRKQVYDVKQRAESAINYYESGQFYFDNLPKPLGWTKTDSNGRFNLTVDQPLSEITIAANTEWLGDGSMVYWVIDLHGSSSATLANDNCIASGSSRSLLHALSGDRVWELTTEDSLEKNLAFITAALTPPPAKVPTITLLHDVHFGSLTLPAGMILRVERNDGSVAQVEYNGQVYAIPVSAMTENP